MMEESLSEVGGFMHNQLLSANTNLWTFANFNRHIFTIAILLFRNMAILSELPDETLHRVLEFVTSDRESLENVSVVNRRLNKIVFPLLVRQWNNSQECLEPSIERLALHLLRNPDLRRHVERLDFGYLRPLHDHDPDSVDLSPESLAALADAAEKDLKVSKFLSTHTLYAYGLVDDLDNELGSGDSDLSLTHLDDYMLPFPVSTSPITELTIVGCLRSGVPDFITGCRTLTKLNVRVDHGLEIYGFPDQKELAGALLKHKDSLQDLDLDISIPKFPNPDPVLEEAYSQLSRIQTLAVHIADFFEGSWSNGGENCIRIVLDRIPQGVQVLKPRSQNFIERWVSSSNDVFLEPYLEGIIELLEEAGSQGRFSKLRLLDLSEAFVDDPIMFDIKRIKQLAKFSGVTVLLHE
ncbi:hypothetical protein FANTH_8216 [Fusarium anthophilum]|uniref:F-box domain-containing protein n=1 Tax=Fusarium anthophilum TaxID=48485 RepID=A0A8H5E143_9HYPO|nr:hypothetical protein FANTH_8216 [Fusarium anthophilum]